VASDTAGPLRLLAEDEQDLRVISAAVQDAVLKVGDIHWEKGPRRLTVGLNRYRWENGRRAERVRSALQVGGVLNVQSRKIRREARRAVLELLALTFEPGEAPGGCIVFEFAGGADLKVEVECLDLVLADVSDAWAARSAPTHEDATTP